MIKQALTVRVARTDGRQRRRHRPRCPRQFANKRIFPFYPRGRASSQPIRLASATNPTARRLITCPSLVVTNPDVTNPSPTRDISRSSPTTPDILTPPRERLTLPSGLLPEKRLQPPTTHEYRRRDKLGQPGLSVPQRVARTQSTTSTTTSCHGRHRIFLRSNAHTWAPHSSSPPNRTQFRGGADISSRPQSRGGADTPPRPRFRGGAAGPYPLPTRSSAHSSPTDVHIPTTQLWHLHP
jgi:hypothetical protein